MKYSHFILGAAICLAAPAGAATLTNGSLTGPLANGTPPAGWQTLGWSPDTNDINEAGGAGGWGYVSAPGVESSDGGTWVGVAAGFGFESFGQQITDFVIGQSITLGWEQFNSGGDFSPGYTNDNAFAVLLDGLVVGTGATSSLGDGWTATSVTFVPTATSQLLGFRLSDDTPSYMNIDGIAFSNVASVPLPGAALMMLTALGGMGALRRRSSMRG